MEYATVAPLCRYHDGKQLGRRSPDRGFAVCIDVRHRLGIRFYFFQIDSSLNLMGQACQASAECDEDFDEVMDEDILAIRRSIRIAKEYERRASSERRISDLPESGDDCGCIGGPRCNCITISIRLHDEEAAFKVAIEASVLDTIQNRLSLELPSLHAMKVYRNNEEIHTGSFFHNRIFDGFQLCY